MGSINFIGMLTKIMITKMWLFLFIYLLLRNAFW